MTEDTFTPRLTAAIQQDGGKVPGEQTFYRATGLSRSDLWRAGFASYGEACKAAGAAPNALQQRFTDDELFRPLAALSRRLGKYPSKGAMEVQRKRDPAFPSWEAYKARERRGPGQSLRFAFVAWCQATPEFADVAAIVDVKSAPRGTAKRSTRIVAGYVYLMRYGTGGQIYKIGRTDNIRRRHAQINAVAPQNVRVVHDIPTDDPEGIERYWLNRFAAKRVDGKNELFRLALDDVAAFRSRGYM